MSEAERLEIIKKEATKLEAAFLAEVNRLLKSGMIANNTSNTGIIRVALENIAYGYSKSHDYKNLTLI